MYILISPKPISEKSGVYLVKSYRDHNGKPTHSIVKTYGKYYDLLKKDKNFLSKLKKQANEASDKDFVKDNVSINVTKKGWNHDIFNFGYIYCKAVCTADRFVKKAKQLSMYKYFLTHLYHMIWGYYITDNPQFIFEKKYELVYPDNKVTMQKFYELFDEFYNIYSKKSDTYIFLIRDILIERKPNITEEYTLMLILSDDGYVRYWRVFSIDDKEVNILAYLRIIEKEISYKIRFIIHNDFTNYFANKYLKNKEKVVLYKTANIAFKKITDVVVNWLQFIDESSLIIENTDNNMILSARIANRIISGMVFNVFHNLILNRFHKNYSFTEIRQLLRIMNLIELDNGWFIFTVDHNSQLLHDFVYSVYSVKDVKYLYPNIYIHRTKLNEQNLIKIISKSFRINKNGSSLFCVE